jgi:hypothetical protein
MVRIRRAAKVPARAVFRQADLDPEGIMLRVLVPLFLATLLAGLVVGMVRRKNRKSGDATPELHKHPERLDQMLDPTDDA